MSIELLGGYLGTTSTPIFGNEITIEERLAWYKGVVVRVKNNFIGEMEDELELADEIQFDGRFRVGGPVWVGPGLSFFLADPLSSARAEALVVLLKVVDFSGTILEIENRLRYTINDEEVDYVNELELYQPLSAAARMRLYLAVENELLVDEDAANELQIGPGIAVGAMNFFAYYVLLTTGAGRARHGVAGGLEFVL
ncbi:MAG: hypothetical protein GF363_01730 [Chitinivibrionales bacterium]|nr:hypothetical protein [Chitinivibrionales bacterium]